MCTHRSDIMFIMLAKHRPRTGQEASRCVKVNHPIIQLRLPDVDLRGMHVGSTMDWMHVAWRLRRLALDPARCMTIGGFHIKLGSLYRVMRVLGINIKDLQPENKQSYDGTLRLFDFTIKQSRDAASKRMFTRITEVNRVRTYLLQQPHDYGTYLYVNLCHRFLRMFVIKDLTPREVVKDAAFCILFLGFWKRDLKIIQPQEYIDLRQHFLTSETFQDVLICCNVIILVVELMAQEHPHIRIDFSRLSSRFSEYVFQALRSATKTSNKFSAMSCVHIINSIITELLSAADGAINEPLQSKRGVPKTPKAVDEKWKDSTRTGYYPCGQEILDLIRQAYYEVNMSLHVMDGCLSWCVPLAHASMAIMDSNTTSLCSLGTSRLQTLHTVTHGKPLDYIEI